MDKKDYTKRAEKMHKTNIDKYGSEEAYREEMRRRGAKANKKTPRGFATMDKEKAREISRRAAQIRWSKHAKNNQDTSH